MRILVLSDCSDEKETGKKLEEELIGKLRSKSYDFKHYNIGKEEINKCIGCFGCWITSPGMCIFDDMTREICRESMNSDVYVILSEIKYGCYSPKIKRVLDRSIGNVLPFFKIIKGEMHHAPRYERYPDLCFIGYGAGITREEEETFRELGQANAINFQVEKAETYICRGLQETEAVVDRLAGYIEKRGGEK
ncbi:MAG: flavodoxin family protein [Bacillota bacterium]|nr:flavodoxin family protein [Bacillota bacterium]